MARIEARQAVVNQLDLAIKACEASYPSIDVRGLKQLVKDDTIQVAEMEVRCARSCFRTRTSPGAGS